VGEACPHPPAPPELGADIPGVRRDGVGAEWSGGRHQPWQGSVPGDEPRVRHWVHFGAGPDPPVGRRVDALGSVGWDPPVSPFLARPSYVPLARPHDHGRQGPVPKPPQGIPGVVDTPILARIAHRLGITLRELDRTLSIEDVLDEMDLAAYIHDLDNPPQPPPKPQQPGKR